MKMLFASFVFWGIKKQFVVVDEEKSAETDQASPWLNQGSKAATR